MPEGERVINRTNLSIISFQLEGLCLAMRHSLACSSIPGPAAVQILSKLFEEFRQRSTGRSLDKFPKIDDTLAPADLLIIAETLRMTVAAFLTPEEFADRAKMIGFNTDAEPGRQPAV
jgi:hypothetical protein